MSAYTASTPPLAALASTSSAEIALASSPLPTRLSPPASTHRTPITDRMVETVMILTVLDLEEKLIPAQGEGDLLLVYVEGVEIAHNVRRTLGIFDGDMNEAVDHICAFIAEAAAPLAY